MKTLHMPKVHLAMVILFVLNCIIASTQREYTESWAWLMAAWWASVAALNEERANKAIDLANQANQALGNGVKVAREIVGILDGLKAGRDS